MLSAVSWRVVADVSGHILTIEDWTDILSRNISNKIRTYAVQNPKGSKTIIIVVFWLSCIWGKYS